jgi:oligopeptide transport system permease protein
MLRLSGDQRFRSAVLKKAGVTSDDYPLGADGLGRDLLSRIIYGARVSLSVAFVGPLSALLVGLTFGLVAGYAGGRVDNLFMRFVDVMYAFPTLLLIILLMAYVRSSFTESQPGTLSYALNQIDLAFGGMFFIFIGIGITSWMTLARLTRDRSLSVREKEYIEAARAMGAKPGKIMFRHMLPEHSEPDHHRRNADNPGLHLV